jgi:hypothetical protein
LVFPQFKFVVLLWLTNFAFAVALSLPIFTLLQDNLGHSVLNSRIYFNFDFIWFQQFIKIYEKSLSAVPITIFSVAGIYIFIQLFYLGGILSVFLNTKKNHMVDFFFGGVKYFFRYLKIAVITFLLYFVALNIDALLDIFIRSAFKNNSNQAIEFLLQFLRYLLFLLWLSIFSLLSDYAKVITAIQDNTKITRAFNLALIFIKNNFSKVLVLYIVLFIVLSLGGIVYNLIESYIPRTPFYFIIISFILQQLLIIYRTVVRMIVYSSEILLYNELASEVIYSQAEEIKIGV